MISKGYVNKTAAASILGRWEARLKLPGLLLLIFTFAFIRDLHLLPFLVLVAALTYSFSGLSLKHLIKSMRMPGFFLIAIALILPFWSGQTVLWQLGPFALRLEGLLDLLVIVVKFFTILILAISLFGTTALPQLAMALRAIGIPWLIADLLLFTFRYIHQLSSDLSRMRIAARLRGFKGTSLNAIKPLAFITGTMLVRSHNQSERVFQAMTLRGYGNTNQPLPIFSPMPADYILLSVYILVSALLILFQFII